MSPADPDARITKMKDGRTHLALIWVKYFFVWGQLEFPL
jgi:hypothetical protein